MQRVADFVIERLYSKYGIKFISLITGNGALVINDAIKKHGKIKGICCHHEQICGYIAFGASKYSNKLSVVNPTTGCASANCITPLLAAYQDHVPVLFLSGNVNLKNTTYWLKKERGIVAKKCGSQETDIIEIVKPLTKYAVMVTDKNRIKYELDKTIDIMFTAPFGPGWIDCPADTGSSLIEENNLDEYLCSFEHGTYHVVNGNYLLDELPVLIKELKNNLEKHERSLVLAGSGIRQANAFLEFRRFIERYNLPFVSTYGANDLLNFEDRLYQGPIGVKGLKNANFAINNCSFLLILGCCLNISQMGYNPDLFAPQAYKTAVDIDELKYKKEFAKIDKVINCNLKDFFRYML